MCPPPLKEETHFSREKTLWRRDCTLHLPVDDAIPSLPSTFRPRKNRRQTEKPKPAIVTLISSPFRARDLHIHYAQSDAQPQPQPHSFIHIRVSYFKRRLRYGSVSLPSIHPSVYPAVSISPIWPFKINSKVTNSLPSVKHSRKLSSSTASHAILPGLTRCLTLATTSILPPEVPYPTARLCGT